MLLKIVSNELAILLNINLKYLSTNKDKYEHDISYFAIVNIDFDKIIESVPGIVKIPYLAGKESNYILKVKARHLKKRTNLKE